MILSVDGASLVARTSSDTGGSPTFSTSGYQQVGYRSGTGGSVAGYGNNSNSFINLSSDLGIGSDGGGGENISILIRLRKGSNTSVRKMITADGTFMNTSGS